MSASFLFCISITLLVLILTIESVHNVYSYDDGNGGEEHCCLVRVRENFCLATPITRSLIQVNRQCGRSNRHKHRRFGRKKNNKYLDKIVRRLNVQTVQEFDDKILIELQKPLEKQMLQNDLICLTSTNNNINLEKCYVELVNETNDVTKAMHKRRKHHGESSTGNANDTDNKSSGNERRRIALANPVRIREGDGLSIRQKYKVTPIHIRPNTREQRQCLSWYRNQTRKIRRNPSKHIKSCVRLNGPREKCINQLVHNNTEQQHSTVSFSSESKLYCENQVGYNKLLGLYYDGEICFYPYNQIYIEYKFSDIAGVSDAYQNKDILEFIASHNKLTAEFQDDCHNKTNLVETSEPQKRPKIRTRS